MAVAMNDANGALKDEYSLDGVHFTEEGYALWFDELRGYIEKI